MLTICSRGLYLESRGSVQSEYGLKIEIYPPLH